MKGNKDLPIEVVFKYLAIDYKNLKIELGKKESYIQELENKLEKSKTKVEGLEKMMDKYKQIITNHEQKLSDENKELRRQIKSEDLYRNLKKKIETLTKSLKTMEKYRDMVITGMNNEGF